MVIVAEVQGTNILEKHLVVPLNQNSDPPSQERGARDGGG